MTLPIYKAIKVILVEKDMPAVSLAKILGINRATITKNVGVNANPTVKTLAKYADALDVSVSDIILKAEQLTSC